MEPTKHCARCKTTKPVSSFFSNKARHDGLSGYCRPCQTAANSGRHQAQRLQVLEALGGARCKRCGFSDVRALVIDHIDGGGSQHRRDSVSVWTMNKYVLEHLEEFQVLCCNCNQIKRYENDEFAGTAYVTKVQETRREVAPKTGRWARDYDACQECGTNERPHKSKGYCENCYVRLLRNGTASREETRQRQSDAAKARWAEGQMIPGRNGREITGRKMVTGPDGKRHWSYPGDADYPGETNPYRVAGAGRKIARLGEVLTETGWLWTYGCGHKIPASEHTPEGKTLTLAPCPVCGEVSVPGTQVPTVDKDS